MDSISFALGFGTSLQLVGGRSALGQELPLQQKGVPPIDPYRQATSPEAHLCVAFGCPAATSGLESSTENEAMANKCLII